MLYTIEDFNRDFADDNACLRYIFDHRYGKDLVCFKCQSVGRFYHVKARKSFACRCGYQVSPTAGTVFHKSGTSLKSWFFAMFLMSQGKNGVPAKELERCLDVTYKTAWRIARQIRILMGQDPSMLLGS